ncbi:MAG: HEPN domain-containing protein [Chloroflexi bacterium]|nr:HEPN domain-containing protein [Chloroflexota bacterium]
MSRTKGNRWKDDDNCELLRSWVRIIGKLNNASIPTRYPSDIRQAIREYTEDVASSYLKQTEEVATWLKAHPILVK